MAADFINPYAAAPDGGMGVAGTPAAGPGFINPYGLVGDNTAPPAPPRSALGEIGVGALRGVLSDAPTMIGQALQYAGLPKFGGAIRGFGQREAQQSWLQARPEGHGTVVNALAQGAEGVGAAVPALAAGAIAGTVGAPESVATLVGAGAFGALSGGQAGQQTLEKAEKAGVAPGAAQTAARLNAAQTFAFNTGMGLVGGQMLGRAGTAIGKVVGSEGTQLASDVLGQMSGTNGVVTPFLKQLPKLAAENVAIGAGQAATQAEIEKSYGIDPNASPLGAAAESIVPSLATTAAFGPLGLVSRALQVRAARERTGVLASAETPPEIRGLLAAQYTEALHQVDPEAAANFAQHAGTAIDTKAGLTVDANMLKAAQQAPAEPLPEAAPAPLALPAPEPGSRGTGTLYTFPDGTTTHDPSIVDAYINGLPENQQVAARAQLLGMGAQPATPKITPELAALHDQIQQELTAAGVAPAVPMTRNEFIDAQFGGRRNAAAVKAYRAYLKDPATQEALMRTDADQYEQLQQRQAQQAHDEAIAAAQPRNPLAEPAPLEAPPARTNTQLADAFAAALKQRQIDHDYALQEATKAQQLDAIANISKGAQVAQAAAEGHIQPDANAPKTADAIVQDWKDAVIAGGLDAKSQSLVPFQKRMDALGLDKLPTHADQITALQSLVDDPKAKISIGVRDRMSMLLDKWRAEQPQEPAAAAPEVAPLEAPRAEVAPEVAPLEASRTEVAPEVAPEAAPAAPTEAAIAAGEPGAPTLGAAPPQAAALGDNTLSSAPDHTDALGENVPALSDAAQQRADQVDMRLAALNDKARSGAPMTAIEQRQVTELQKVRALFGQLATPGAKLDETGVLDYADRILNGGQQSIKPPRLALMTGPRDADTVDPAILAPAALSHNLSDVLEGIKQSGSSDEVKKFAARLQPLTMATKIYRDGPPRVEQVELNGKQFENTYAGGYDPSTDEITVSSGAESEHVVMHEATHAATVGRINEAIGIDRPANQYQAQLKSAFNQLESIRNTLLKIPDAIEKYGLTSPHEFVAEMYSNPEFQQFLRDAGTGKTLWQRGIDAVRRMLGLSVDDRNALERAMSISDPFFGKPEQVQDFEKSPSLALKIIDGRTAAMTSKLDKLPKDIDFMKIDRGLLRAFSGWQTVQYIADRVRAVPEMVQSGFSQAMDNFEHANLLRRMASEAIEGMNGKYLGKVSAYLKGLKDSDKARDLSETMMRLSGESSIGEFDFTKNYNQNKAVRPYLQDENKAYIDSIHRDFTQLRQQHPELAQALEDGGKLNRKMNTIMTASLARNLMRARSGGIEGAIGDAHAARLDFMDKSLAQAANSDPSRYADGAASELAKRLDAAFKAARTLPDGTPLRTHLGELESMYRAQIDNPYFSLGRNGNYFVKVGFKDMDPTTAARLQDALKGTNKVLGNILGGQDHAFFRVQTPDEARGLHAKLVEAGQGKVVDTAWGPLISREGMNARGVTPALRSMLASLSDEIDGNPSITPEHAGLMKAALTRQLLSLLPETSARSAKMQRRGIPGYEADFLGNFGRRASGAVQDIANTYTGGAFADAFKQMDDAAEQLNRTGSTDGRLRAGVVRNEISKRYLQGMQPLDNTALTTINALGHSFYLTLNPAFYIRTMAQPYHRGVPYLGSRYGFINSAKEIGRATAPAIKLIGRSIEAVRKGVDPLDISFDDMGLTDSEKVFAREMQNRGVLKLGLAQQLQHAALGGNEKLRNLSRFAGMTAQYAEMTNRFVTGLAAFRLAEAKGLDHEANTEYAIKAIDRVMDNFDPSNTARLISKHGLAGKYTPLTTTFMNYNLQTMQQITRAVHDGYFNADQSPAGVERKVEARREFQGLMATTAMISGALGLPFANAFAGVYNWLVGDQDNPQDIRASVRNFFHDVAGAEGGEVLSHGLGGLLNVDTSSFGLQDLLPFSELIASRALLQDRLENQSKQLLGPTVNAMLDGVLAIDKINDGYWMKGIEQLLPSGLKAPYKAAELAGVIGPGGYTDARGNPIGLKANGWDIALQLAGFRTAAKATQSEAAMDFAQYQRRIEFRKDLIADEIYKGVSQQDSAAFQKGLRDMAAFNSQNMYEPITDINQMLERHMIALAVGSGTGTGVMGSARQSPLIAQRERFAAMPRGQ